jgi:hypothetical protein
MSICEDCKQDYDETYRKFEGDKWRCWRCYAINYPSSYAGRNMSNGGE